MYPILMGEHASILVWTTGINGQARPHTGDDVYCTGHLLAVSALVARIGEMKTKRTRRTRRTHTHSRTLAATHTLSISDIVLSLSAGVEWVDGLERSSRTQPKETREPKEGGIRAQKADECLPVFASGDVSAMRSFTWMLGLST